MLYCNITIKEDPVQEIFLAPARACGTVAASARLACARRGFAAVGYHETRGVVARAGLNRPA
jgi:hypothetical protein